MHNSQLNYHWDSTLVRKNFVVKLFLWYSQSVQRLHDYISYCWGRADIIGIGLWFRYLGSKKRFGITDAILLIDIKHQS